MQRLSLELLQYSLDPGRIFFSEIPEFSIQWVAEQSMTDGAQVHPDLMGTTGFQTTL